MVARLRCTRLLSVTGYWVTNEAMTSAFFRFRHLAANKTWHGVVENTLKARASHMYPVTFEHLKRVLVWADFVQPRRRPDYQSASMG
jgi:hypothetical protein